MMLSGGVSTLRQFSVVYYIVVEYSKVKSKWLTALQDITIKYNSVPYIVEHGKVHCSRLLYKDITKRDNGSILMLGRISLTEDILKGNVGEK